MNAKYTPGPWGLIGSVHPVGDAGDVYCGSVVPDPWRGSVCSIQSADHINGISREEAEANGRLIAAAPELLDALKQIIWKLERKEVVGSKFDGGVRCEFAKIDRNDAVIGLVRSAIAKATGEQ